LIALLRKELTHHLRHNRRDLLLWLLLLLGLSAVSALLIWRDRWHALERSQGEQVQTNLGLLELRVNQHRTTALDWGHWDTMYAFAGGQDQNFVERELLPSSIVADRQVLLISNTAGRTLALEPRTPLTAGLRSCIEQRLQRLRQRTPGAAITTAFGLYCRDGQQVLIGAGTGIRPSGGQAAERGWVIHLSTLERPSYNPSLNRTFQAINRSLVLEDSRGHSSPATQGQPVAGISELLPADQRFVMIPPLDAVATAHRAAEQAIPPWLALNLAGLTLLPGGLVLARQRRLPTRIRALQDKRTERKRRQRIARVLTTRRQMLLLLEHPPQALEQGWIAALHVTEAATAPEKQRTLENLALAISEQLQPEAMGLIDPESLALVIAARHSAQLRNQLQQLCHPQCSGSMAPLQAGQGARQLLTLCAARRHRQAAEPIEVLQGVDPQGGDGQPVQLPIEQWQRQLATGNFRLEPIQVWNSGRSQMLYSAIRLHPWLPGAADGEERSGIDAALLRTALSWLERSTDPTAAVGIPLAASSLEAGGATLIAELGSARAEQRARLVVELSESMRMADSVALRQAVGSLQHMGVRVAIDDFGNRPLPIQALFQLEPAFLKLEAGYSQRLQDESVNDLVAFLLSYCRYHNCTLVLQGIASSEQLQYWQRRGVKAFQCNWTACDPASARP
jgi:EAL domain-containing protein (putative c-di-GMP-specific phosphodiesterase class I)